MATNTRTQHTIDPAAERAVHPVRPASRRPLRDPHHLLEGGTGVGPLTTPAGPAPSSARPALGETDAGGRADASTRPLVAPTAVPDVSGDLLGLPDLSALRRGLARAGGWLIGRVRAAARTDARLRARRDEDSAAMLRSGVAPTRYV